MSESMDNNGSDDDYEDTVDTPTHETKSGSDDEVIAVLSEEELNELRDKSLALKSEANDRFRDQLYDESIELYTKALDTCPPEFSADRAVVHSNRSAAHLHCHRLDEALNDCNEAILLDDHYVKAILRRAQIYRQMGNKLDESLKDYERVLELDTSCAEAKTASNELRHEINERNERLKTEMMSKLKDLGNLVLRPFGLSTDNFKLSQNGETGGYSVNFQNN